MQLGEKNEKPYEIAKVSIQNKSPKISAKFTELAVLGTQRLGARH